MKAEEYWDKSCYGKDRTNEMPHWGGNLIYFITYPIGKLLWRIKVENREKIRCYQGKTGAVLIANHISYLDVYCMYNAVRLKQWVRFIGKEELFTKSKLLAKWLSRAGVIPIKRDTADRKAIKRAAKMLKNQELVGIMPEGTRRGKSGVTPTLHAGAAFIARMGGNVPIVPMTSRNVEKIKKKGERIRFPKVTVDFGDPVLLKDFDFLPKNKRMEACTWYAMRECFALFRRTNAENIDMVELFPECEDYTQVFKEHPIPKHNAQEVADSYVKKD